MSKPIIGKGLPGSFPANYKILNHDDVERLCTACYAYNPPLIALTELGRRLGLIAFVREESCDYITPPHNHNYLEIVFVLAGSGIHIINGEEYPIKKGDIFFLNYDLVHTFKATPRRRLTYVNFAFLPAFLSQSLSLERFTEGMHFFLIEPFFRADDRFRYKISLKDGAFYRLAHMALLIVDRFNRCYPEVCDTAHLQFKAFVQVVLDEYRTTVQSRPEIFGQREKIFREIYAYIEKHLEEKILLDDIASAVGACRSRITDIFKAQQGESIIAYVNRRRIEEAVQLLKETSLSVIDISLRVGYNDISHFNTPFRAIMHTRPLDLRKKSGLAK
ncbi:MAG: AraC family transcriptional regulator [Chitinivibrionales bacterium]|nr:AraC family transcriptional regulator [Chitinivibrionales bacterium]